MVRVLWLLAVSVATVLVSGAVAESESEAGRVRVVVLHGSESGEQDEMVETEEKSKTKKTNKHKHKVAVVKETIVVGHKVKKVKKLHGKSWLGDVLDDIKEAIYGSESGSGSAEVGQETVVEEKDEEEGGEIETPTPFEQLTKKHAVHKSSHHKNKKHAAATAHTTNEHAAKHKSKHAATAKKQQQHPAKPHPAEAVTLSQSDSERSAHRLGETSFVVIGAAVGALVGVVALAVVAVAMRRRRSAATYASDVAAISQCDDDDEAEVEAAAPVPVVRGEEDEQSLEGCV